MNNTLAGVTIVATGGNSEATPFFSVCIPQYNRTSFLIEACRSLAEQSFRSFEICIADDRSTDGRERELIAFLASSGLAFTFARQDKNRRYDGNLRSAISLARGEYIFLLGNDDRLAASDTLERIHRNLLGALPVDVAIANYRELGTGRTFERVPVTGRLGEGPSAAVQTFRNFSFVSGVIFRTEAAHTWYTEKWDGSEMYQMYIGCRILAAGGTLMGLSEVCVEKDIQIASEKVDSYAVKKIVKRDFKPVFLPMSKIAPLVADAIEPYVSRGVHRKTVTRIASQLLVFTYAFWLIELRRVQSWKYAVSVYRGLGPAQILQGSPVAWPNRAAISFLYLIVGFAGLATPVGLFQALQPMLYRLAKRGSGAKLSPVPASSAV